MPRPASPIISPQPLTVTPDSFARVVGVSNPVFTGTVVGLTNGDPIVALYSCAATTNSPAGFYPITVTLDDPGSFLANYTVTLNQGTLTITNMNQAPSVTITQPVAGATMVAGGTQSIVADATDGDGTVSVVDFYVDGSWLGGATAVPYRVTWTNSFAGTYSLTAQVMDDQGAAATSAVVVVTSLPSFRQTLWVTSGIPRFQMTYHGASGEIYVSQYSGDLITWTNLVSVTDTVGGVTVSDTNAPGSKRYYRMMPGD
jgi:hypothetical protein